MISVIVLVVVIYFASSLITTKQNNVVEINKLIRKSYKYSGLNPSIHNEFIENIKMALEYKTNIILSKKLMNRSLTNLDEIALSSVSGDTNLLEDIDTIISDLKTNFNELYTNCLLYTSDAADEG